MYRELPPVYQELTRDVVEDHATNPGWPGERPFSPAREESLKARFDAGQFYSPAWAVAQVGKKRVRMDGQHSAAMLSKLNGEFPKGMKVLVRQFACDDEQDLPELFAQFDGRTSVRSDNDIVNSVASLYRDLDGVARSTIRRAMDGIILAANAGEVSKLSIDTRVRMIHENRQFAVFASRFIGPSRMGPIGLVAAMHLTWAKAPQAAGDFWGYVKNETHPDAAHPTRRLAVFLREFADAAERKRWSPRAVMVKAIHAWNAFRSGEQTRLQYSEGNPVPDVL